MRLRLLFICIILATSSHAQQIGRHQADSLLRVIDKTKPGAQRITLLIKLAEYHVFKPGESVTDLDSAKSYLEEAERLNKTVQSTTLAGHQLLIKGFMLREKGQKPEGRQAVEQAVPLLEKGADKYLLGKAYFEWQGYYDFFDSADRKQRILLTHKAVEAFQQAGEMEQKGHALRMLGELYGKSGESAHAIDYLNRARVVYDSIHHEKLHGIQNQISREYYRIGDFKNAMQYASQALKTAQAVQDTTKELAVIYNTLGLLYRNAGYKELALKYFKETLKVILRYHDTVSAISLAFTTSSCYLDMNQSRQALYFLDSVSKIFPADPDPQESILIGMMYVRAYLVEKNSAASYKYAMMIENAIEVPGLQHEVRDMGYILLATYYMTVQNLKKARQYVNKSLLIPYAPNKIMQVNRARVMYRVDSAAGFYKGAFDYLNTYKKISDSLTDEVKSHQFQQLEVEYETSKKADSILLLTQKSALQTANLRQANLVRNVTIAGILLAMVIIGLLYRQYQLKQNSNKVISQKNEHLEHLVTEKEWLLKEVHHRVKNNLQTIMSLLELQLDTVSKDAQFAIQTSQNRIYTTSLLHQKLYRSENVSSVNMQVYLTELIQHLRDTYGVNNTILFTTNIAPVELDVTQGVPIGLIVNEVVTNSLKYAFNQEVEQPAIIVSLTMSGDIADLLIADNGTGFSSVNDDNPGLGLKLVKGLAQDIDGHISITADNGTSALIRFKPRLSLANSLGLLQA